jgi:hypothetical protein
MLGLIVKNEYLDLMPGTSLDLQRENPFLSIEDSLPGEYSLPFAIPASEKNMRLLGFPNIISSRKTTVGIPAILMSDGVQHSKGQVKLETGNSNVNQPARGIINLYYLFGVSDFYKLVEGKTLQDLDLGPDYTFPYNNDGLYNDPATFYGYISKVLREGNPTTYDYALFPIVNKQGLIDFPTSDMILNHVGAIIPPRTGPFLIPNNNSFNAISRDITTAYPNQLCPFVYLRKVIVQAFKFAGWSVKGAPIDTGDFSMLVILYNNLIDYRGEGFATGTVKWNLKQHVPRVKISTFLIALQNRFGWMYDWDYQNKICTINDRVEVFKNRKRKDFTSKSGANYSFKVNAQNKIYALIQAVGEDKPESTDPIYQGVMGNINDLPVATTSNINHKFLVLSENSFYCCLLVNNVPKWTKTHDNTTNYKPVDKTDEIETKCLVPDSIAAFLPPFPEGGVSTTYTMNVPHVDLNTSLGETETFYVCYHHGLTRTTNKSGQVDLRFPFGSAGCYDLHGNRLRDLALIYEYYDGTTERGLYFNKWRYFLNLIRQREEVTIPIALSLDDMLALKFTDSIIIHNVEYFIKSQNFSLPLKPFTSVQLVRIQ